MRILALALVLLAILGDPLSAQAEGNADRHQQKSACFAWRVSLMDTVRHQARVALLTPADEAAVTDMIEMMGKRCSGTDPRRISQLYAVVLDTLSDQRHQP